MRTIEFHVDPVDLQTTEQELYKLYGPEGIHKLHQALGRLVTYCNDHEDAIQILAGIPRRPVTYDRVTIFFNKRDMEFVARYVNTVSNHRFTIGAVYRGSLPGEELKPCEWSFHS
jgi:hypothetical protein